VSWSTGTVRAHQVISCGLGLFHASCAFCGADVTRSPASRPHLAAEGASRRATTSLVGAIRATHKFATILIPIVLPTGAGVVLASPLPELHIVVVLLGLARDGSGGILLVLNDSLTVPVNKQQDGAHNKDLTDELECTESVFLVSIVDVPYPKGGNHEQHSALLGHSVLSFDDLHAQIGSQRIKEEGSKYQVV